MKQQSFLDRIPSFSLLLVMVILIVVGLGLTPLIDVGASPMPRQGKTLNVNFSWANASPRVIEQEVTSKIEGLVSAVNGVEEVTSVSRLGSGNVKLQLKEDANVSMIRFEISSLLKQISEKLPEGVSYPTLSGGTIASENASKPTTETLLAYQINADMDGEQIKEYIEHNVTPVLSALEDVVEVRVTGGTSKYIEIVYDPIILSNYGLTAGHISDGIKAFMGKSNIVGDIEYVDGDDERQRITLHLGTSKFSGDLGDMPLTTVNGKIIYLNDLATYEYKDRLPSRYYRVNGLNTVYMNIIVNADANMIKLSESLRAKIDELKPQLRSGIYLTLTKDASEEMQTELEKLIRRTGLSLLILLLFVWIVSRQLKYLAIIFITLVANITIAIILYYLCDLRLHIFSLAGITVSLGMIIDSSIVMVDHYSYYHNRKSFLAILAALLTTIGSLIVIFFMPDYIQRDLYDFSRIIIINLSVALVVALFFVPALVQRFHYDSRQTVKTRQQASRILSWSRLYNKYLMFTQKRKWIYFLVLILAFGLPFFAMPDKIKPKRQEYYMRQSTELSLPAKWYNAVFGSPFYLTHLKKPISVIFGGTMQLFASSLDSQTFSEKERDVVLNIRAQMPLGGSVHQLNEKVAMLEKFLAGYSEIKRFETTVSSGGAKMTVEFKDEYKKGYFPYYLESMVIGQELTIGGADWSTYGVSERGFSNSLRLGYRSDQIEIAGYNYNRLYKYAEEMCEVLQTNRRVTDLIIENDVGGSAVDELYMDFDREKIALYDFDLSSGYRALRELLTENELGRYTSDMIDSDILLKSAQLDRFDLWHLLNSYIKVGEKDIPFSVFGHIEQRKAKNSIPKKNQEYTLNIRFNYIGSYESRNRYITEVTESFNQKFPVGYRCLNTSRGYYKDKGTQYWLILLIVVIIFFMCSILFESLRLPFVIILLIPVSFIGTFLTFYFTKVPFGTGGFASLVLLCGIVVNAGIYIINEYENIRKEYAQKGLGSVSAVRLYLKAYHHKIIPVFLTVLSTVLGLVPFFLYTDTNEFWFSFAVGTSGGLVFSIFALVFVMPIFLRLVPRGVS